MSIRAIFLHILAGLLLVLSLAGCATSSQRSRYLRSLETGPVTNLTAFRSGTNLLLRFPLQGKPVFAHASWPAPPSDPDYHYEFAALQFEPQGRSVRNSVTRAGDRITVRDAAQWQQLVQRIFYGLAPHEPGHGVVLLVRDRELVLYRNAAGRLAAAKLENKPADVIIDLTLNDADFSREAIQLLETGVRTIDRNQNQFLFATGEEAGFALIDLRQRLVIFLSHPDDPETQPLDFPAWFALRAFHSLFIRSYAIMAVKSPFTLVGRGLWNLGNSGAAAISSSGSSDPKPPQPLAKGPGMDLKEWESHLDDILGAHRYKGRLDFYIDGEKFFPALIQAITSALHTVDVQVFIFDNDDYAVKIADLLKQRSSAVRVRVLMDEMGSLFAGMVPPHTPMPPDFVQPDDIRFYLTSGSQVHVRSSANPWLTVDHRKCIVIDGRQAFIGGMNIGREYRYEWHDMMISLTGPVVAHLQKDYRLAWAHAGWLGDFAYIWVKLFSTQRPIGLAVSNPIDIRPLRTATGLTDIYRAQLEAIQRAKSYIYIENAYFDDGRIQRALIDARQRGVDVRVVVPSENDSGIMQTGNLMMANTMMASGIRVYAYPGMTHVKAAIYDGWACLGSANFDKMSLRISQELDVGFSDPETVGRLKEDLFETDFSRSRELKGPAPMDWRDSLVKALADQL